MEGEVQDGRHGETRHSCTDKFREQVARLVTDAGRSRQQAAREYGVSVGTSWVRRFRTAGPFRDDDLLTADQRENKALRKRVAELTMEAGLPKQAALIPGRK